MIIAKLKIGTMPSKSYFIRNNQKIETGKKIMFRGLSSRYKWESGIIDEYKSKINLIYVSRI